MLSDQTRRQPERRNHAIETMVRAKLDRASYARGIDVTDSEMKKIAPRTHDFLAEETFRRRVTLSCIGLVFQRAALTLLHERSPEVLLRGELIVISTSEGHVRHIILPTPRERLNVVKLQATRLAAAPAELIQVGAASFIALEHPPPH